MTLEPTMTQPADAPGSALPAVPAGMTRREYKQYLATLRGVDGAPQAAPDPATPTSQADSHGYGNGIHGEPSSSPHAESSFGGNYATEAPVPPAAHFSADLEDVARAAAARARLESRSHVSGGEAAPSRRRPQSEPQLAGPRSGARQFHFDSEPSTGNAGNGQWYQAPIHEPKVAEDAPSLTSLASQPCPVAPVLPFPARSEPAEVAAAALGADGEAHLSYDNGTETVGATADIVPIIRRRDSQARRRRKGLNFSVTTMLPKVGMVGALGFAAVAAPMVVNAQSETLNVDAATERDMNAAAQLGVTTEDLDGDIVDAEPAGSAPTIATGEDLRLDRAPISQGHIVAQGVPGSLEELTQIRERAEAASRDFNRAALPGCDETNVKTNGKNGRLDESDLCSLWDSGHKLRADAAVALAELNEAYTAHFGDTLSITDSYRTYAEQVSVKRRKPGLAAKPGTSEHGWGLAVDLADGIPTAGERYRWMRENAPQYGWENPAWARAGGSGAYEPWHWEYVGGDKA